MEEAKILGQLGAFGIIGLIICLFIGCTICLCLTVHVRFIYTFLCPIQNLQTCCRLFAQKFRASHKPIPNSILDLEKQISGSKRAQKIARRVNQSQSLRDFHCITPRLNSFIVDLQQESSRQVVYNRSSDQVLLPSVITAEPKGRLLTSEARERLNLPKGPKTGSPFEAAGSPFEAAGSPFEPASKNSALVQLHPPPVESAINQAAKPSQSLFSEPITTRNTQTENLSLVSDIELRARTRSIDQLTRVPLPQIKFVKEGINTCEGY